MKKQCDNSLPKYLTRKDLAEALRIHVRTLDSYCQQYGVPFKRMGRRIFFDRVQIQEFMRTNTILVEKCPLIKRAKKVAEDGHSGLSGIIVERVTENGHMADGKSVGDSSRSSGGDELPSVVSDIGA